MVHDLINPGIIVANAKVARLHAQCFAHGKEGIKHQFLRHYAQTLARTSVIRNHIVTLDGDATLIGTRQTGNDGN